MQGHLPMLNIADAQAVQECLGPATLITGQWRKHLNFQCCGNRLNVHCRMLPHKTMKVRD